MRNVDNFDLLKKYIKFNTEDDFYFLQIIMRRKENCLIGSDNTVIKSYYVNTESFLDKKYREIKSLCIEFNARAYINLTCKSFEKVAFISLEKIAESLKNKEYKYMRRLYDSSCGEVIGVNKKWILDIDFIGDITNIINEINMISDQSVIDIIPTPNGQHIITYPFRLDLFQDMITKFKIEIHKNNPTVLFYGNSKIYF